MLLLCSLHPPGMAPGDAPSISAAARPGCPGHAGDHAAAAGSSLAPHTGRSGPRRRRTPPRPQAELGAGLAAPY